MIKINDKKIDTAYFPDGTSSFRADIPDGEISLTWCFDGNEEMITLFYLVNHIRRIRKDAKISLVMPYIPNARMDRVKNADEVFTLKYFSQFLNSLDFETVKVYDPHSNVSEALINSMVIMPHVPFIEEVMDRIDFRKENDVLFYPDAGCAKKYENAFCFPYLKGDKKRDWRTGKIEGLELIGNIPSENYNVLIIDDICSRGGTFLHSAKKLKECGAGDIYLYVTHCENTILDGELINSGLIKKIFTTDSIYTSENENIEIIRTFR